MIFHANATINMLNITGSILTVQVNLRNPTTQFSSNIFSGR